MFQAVFRTTCLAILGLTIAPADLALASERDIPKPLPDHPGNVFLVGEEVAVQLSGAQADAWRCVDYDGQVVAKGRGAGTIHLGRLPVGYYEVRRDASASHLPPSERRVAVAVLPPLKAPTPETSPIDCDVAMASACPEAKMPAAANLCALAGMNWVRDRFVWRALEPARDRFAAKCLYDAASSG